MRKIYFILPALFFIQSISYAHTKPINSASELDTAIQISLSEDDSRTALTANDWFYVGVYGGVSYKNFPQSKESITQSWGSDDLYQPAKRYSPYFAAEFGIRPWQYLSFGIRYWDAGSTSVALDNYNGLITQSNGESKMHFSGINILMTAHFPIASIDSEILLSTGPAIVFSQFSPSASQIPDYNNPALKESSKTNIRPFISLGYQYLLPYSLILGLEAQYIFGIGENTYSPYYNGSYVPSMLNLSLSLGYHF
ncbi:hypothetical protein [Cysteiniphilum sp. QT6929]|uniref:hypothetical protein n=1 Tax=Cysteiniphilum sp. QT6929 TaxID=2975055 RepID=UPI0024B39907|nr:hypothetical protein [Cysteiniphilum sp. QT6929]WHN64858.1 hypothetical protein NYP54_07320 [Cysteiniphilum sp. QT6929]